MRRIHRDGRIVLLAVAAGLLSVGPGVAAADLAPPYYATYHARRAREEGLLALRLGRIDDALESAGRAVELTPEDADALYLLGVCQVFAERYDEAAVTLGRVVEIDPDLAEAHHDLGLVRLKLGDAAGAASAFDRLADLRPDSWLGPYRRAQVSALLEGDWKGCEEHLAVALDRGFPWLASLPVDPEWSEVASDPSFLALVQRLLDRS